MPEPIANIQKEKPDNFNLMKEDLVTHGPYNWRTPELDGSYNFLKGKFNNYDPDSDLFMCKLAETTDMDLNLIALIGLDGELSFNSEEDLNDYLYSIWQ